MAVSVFANGKWRSLEGTYVYSTSEGWKKVGAFDRLYADGNWHNVGMTTDEADMSSREFDTSISFVDYDETHPTATYYVSPHGNGNGTSWEDAASFVRFVEILSNCQGTEVFCFLEGEYESRDTITVVGGVHLYGGFSVDDTSWEARNPFAHQTIFTPSSDYDGGSPWMDADMAVSVLVDGFTVAGYGDGVKDLGESTIRNCLFDGLTGDGLVEAGTIFNTKFHASDFLIYGSLESCIIENTSQNAHVSGNATNCTLVSTAGSFIVEGDVSRSTAVAGDSEVKAGRLEAGSIYDTVIIETGMVAVSNESRRNKYWHCSVNVNNSYDDMIVFGNSDASMHIVNASNDMIVGRTGDDCYRDVVMDAYNSSMKHSCVTAVGNGDNALPCSTGSFVIMDGDLYHWETDKYVRVTYDDGRIPVSRWTAVTGYSRRETSVVDAQGTNTRTNHYAYAIGYTYDSSSMLYLLDASDGGVSISQVMVQGDMGRWTLVTGHSKREVVYTYDHTYEHQVVSSETRTYAYGINDEKLYCLDGNVATVMASLPQNGNGNGTVQFGWSDVSGYSENRRNGGNESGSDANWQPTTYSYGIRAGMLYALCGTKATRVGTSDNAELVDGWTDISGVSTAMSVYAFGINNGNLYSIGLGQGISHPIASLNTGESGWTQVNGQYQSRTMYGLGVRNGDAYAVGRFFEKKVEESMSVQTLQFEADVVDEIEVDLVKIGSRSFLKVIPYSSPDATACNGIRRNGESGNLKLVEIFKSEHPYISDVTVSEGFRVSHSHSAFRIGREEGTDGTCSFSVEVSTLCFSPDVIGVDMSDSDESAVMYSEYQMSFSQEGNPTVRETVHLAESHSMSDDDLPHSTFVDHVDGNHYDLHRSSSLHTLSIVNGSLYSDSDRISNQNGWTFACGQVGSDMSYVGFAIRDGYLHVVRGFEGTLTIEKVENVVMNPFLNWGSQSSESMEASADGWECVSSGIRYNEDDVNQFSMGVFTAVKTENGRRYVFEASIVFGEDENQLPTITCVINPRFRLNDGVELVSLVGNSFVNIRDNGVPKAVYRTNGSNVSFSAFLDGRFVAFDNVSSVAGVLNGSEISSSVTAKPMMFLSDGKIYSLLKTGNNRYDVAVIVDSDAIDLFSDLSIDDRQNDSLWFAREFSFGRLYGKTDSEVDSDRVDIEAVIKPVTVLGKIFNVGEENGNQHDGYETTLKEGIGNLLLPNMVYRMDGKDLLFRMETTSRVEHNGHVVGNEYLRTEQRYDSSTGETVDVAIYQYYDSTMGTWVETTSPTRFELDGTTTSTELATISLDFIREIDKSDTIGMNGSDSVVLEGGSLTGKANGVENATNTKFINCGGLLAVRADGSLFVNCATSGDISNHSKFCTYAGCVGNVREGDYNVYWNSEGTIPSANNMQSDNVEGNLLTLSVLDKSENGIARFIDTGYSPSQGRISAQECPNPAYSMNGYNEWTGMFGDFRLSPDSSILNPSYRIVSAYIDDRNAKDVDGANRGDSTNAGAFHGGTSQE